MKIPVADAASMRALLRQKGFRVHKPRVFEQNLVLDDAQGSVKARNLLLRLRTAGKTVTCTFKNKEVAGVHKRREEREFHLDNLEEGLAVFEGLGYSPAWKYEKYRTEFVRAQEGGEVEPGIITLDETPIGTFVELEGPARWIDRTAKGLGFSRRDYITASYGALFFQWCNEYGIESNAMTFEKSANLKLH